MLYTSAIPWNFWIRGFNVYLLYMNQDRVGSVVSLRVRENKILRPLIQMTDGRHSATVEPECTISQKKTCGCCCDDAWKSSFDGSRERTIQWNCPNVVGSSLDQVHFPWDVRKPAGHSHKIIFDCRGFVTRDITRQLPNFTDGEISRGTPPGKCESRAYG